MRDFIYYTPTKVFFGRGRESQSGEILRGYGFSKVALHYGQGSVKRTGLLDRIISSLEDAKIDFVHIGGVEPNPKYDFALLGAETCVREKVDAILAVGGGSVADSAKLMAAAVRNPGIEPWKFFTKEALPETSLPIGVVLTLAAAGSEMSESCVITNEQLGIKRGFNSEYNRPLFTVMDPELTYTVSPFQTSCGVVDIMMHTFERYFHPEEEAELTHSISEALLRSIIKAGTAVSKDPFDYNARATLMWGSSLSHNGLTGAGKSEFLQLHQIEHALSGTYDEVAHAAGLSALFRAWAMHVYRADIDKFARFAVNVWGCDVRKDAHLLAVEGIEKCTAFFSGVLKMPVSLNDLGIGSEKIDEMTRKCSNNGTRKLPGVKELDEGDIREILVKSLV